MKNEQKFQGKWVEIKSAIQNRWSTISEGEIIQADGISELASVISKKVGEPRPNILHELINLIQVHDKEHPFLKDYFANTSGARGESIGPEDDGRREIRPDQVQ